MMIKSPDTKKIFCFGEVLWDILPTTPKPGGAPMNVAYHLNKMETEAFLISRVGDDICGDLLLDVLKKWNLPTQLVGVDPEYPTSEVIAMENEDHEMSYEILSPVAWDFISYENGFSRLVSKADALVFGSLITRNETSRETLFKLLESSNYNVFDVNLRPPHFSPDIIGQLLHKTNLLKLNEQELELLTTWFSDNCSSEAARINVLQEQFGITEILVTKGSKGASYYAPEGRIDCPAYKVKVADTVGSGDAFLAAFLAKRLQHKPAAEALAYAAALGAFVAMNEGACPSYTPADLESFKEAQERQAVLN